jgi:hypothetical protein
MGQLVALVLVLHQLQVGEALLLISRLIFELQGPFNAGLLKILQGRGLPPIRIIHLVRV